jgi:hypothetical protein
VRELPCARRLSRPSAVRDGTPPSRRHRGRPRHALAACDPTLFPPPRPTASAGLTFCVKPDLYVHGDESYAHLELSGTGPRGEQPTEGPGDAVVKQDARPTWIQTDSGAGRLMLRSPQECPGVRRFVSSQIGGGRWPKRSTGEKPRREPGARLATVARGQIMTRLLCHEQRMLRALHGRWPYRRSHCRHDLHWLVRVRTQGGWCSTGRAHSLAALRGYSRRGPGG